MATILLHGDEYKKFYEQFAGNMKPGAHENFENGSDTAELVRFNTLKSEDQQERIEGVH